MDIQTALDRAEYRLDNLLSRYPKRPKALTPASAGLKIATVVDMGNPGKSLEVTYEV